MIKQILLAGFVCLFAVVSFASDDGDTAKPLSRLAFAQLRSTASVERALALKIGRLPRRPRRAMQIAEAVSTPKASQSTTEIPDLPKECAIVFQEAQELTTVAPPPYSDELHFSGKENQIEWLYRGYRHVLHLQKNPLIQTVQYETYRDFSDSRFELVTSQTHFERFLKELNRMMIIDPSLRTLLAEAQITVPAVDWGKVPPPPRVLFRFTEVPRAKVLLNNYWELMRRDPTLKPYTDSPMRIEAPGVLVWQSSGVRHLLYLRDVPGKGLRGSYSSEILNRNRTTTVTCQSQRNRFMIELNRVRGEDPQIDLAVKLAGIKF